MVAVDNCLARDTSPKTSYNKILSGATDSRRSTYWSWLMIDGIILNCSNRKKVQIALLKKCASFQQPPTLHKNTVSYVIIILCELLLGWYIQTTCDKPQWRIIIRQTNQSYSGVSFLQQKKPQQDLFMLSTDCCRFLSTEHYKTKGIVKWKEKQTLVLPSKKVYLIDVSGWGFYPRYFTTEQVGKMS